MRIALISDIHGNLVALDAAVSDARASGVARFLCLGDVALVGPRPRACIARVSALGCPVVMGNTDAWLIDPVQPATVPEQDDRRVLHDVARWGAERISEADRETLRTYAPTVEMNLSEKGEGSARAPLLAYHGSPSSYDQVIAPDAQDDQLATIFGDSAQRCVVLAGGHTHRPMVRRFQRATIVNPGSVGLAVVREPGGPSAAWNPAWAEYAILDWSEGRLSIDLRRIPYSLAEYIDSVEASGMPHGERFAGDFRAAWPMSVGV